MEPRRTTASMDARLADDAALREARVPRGGRAPGFHIARQNALYTKVHEIVVDDAPWRGRRQNYDGRWLAWTAEGSAGLGSTRTMLSSSADSGPVSRLTRKLIWGKRATACRSACCQRAPIFTRSGSVA